MELADRLAALMRSRGGLSANKLASMSGVAQTQISRVLRSESSFTVDTLQMICDALDISVSEFMDVESGNQYDSIRANSDEIELIMKYRDLSEHDKQTLMSIARIMRRQMKPVEEGPHETLPDRLDAEKE